MLVYTCIILRYNQSIPFRIRCIYSDPQPLNLDTRQPYIPTQEKLEKPVSKVRYTLDIKAATYKAKGRYTIETGSVAPLSPSLSIS